MANVFCSSTGSNTAPYETWAKAATTFATAVGAAGAGDIIAVDAASPPADITTNTTWTFAANCSVVASTNSGTSTITPTTMGATTWLGNSSTNTVTVAGAFRVYFYGITFRSGATSGAPITINNSDGGHFELEDCYLWCSGTGGSLVFGANTASSNQYTLLKNTTLRFGGTNQTIQARAALEMLGGSVSSAGSAPTTLFQNTSNQTSARLVGVDLSHITGTLVPAMQNSSVIFEFVQCHFSTSLTAVMAAQTPTNKSSARVFVFDCNAGNADTHGRFEYHDAFGSLTTDTGIYYTTTEAKLTDSTNTLVPLSWKVVTTANCSFSTPFVTPWVSLYHTGTSAITPRFEILRDGSTTAFKNSEVWGEFGAKRTSGVVTPTFANDRQALADWAAGTTGADQTAGAGTGSWSGENASAWSGKVDSGSSITPAEAGHILGRVAVGVASATVYVDPVIRT